jgi:hypothetical protein
MTFTFSDSLSGHSQRVSLSAYRAVPQQTNGPGFTRLGEISALNAHPPQRKVDLKRFKR